MDERSIAVYKAAAREHLNYDSWGESMFCGYCYSAEQTPGVEFHADAIKHRPGCATLIARELLREQGTPFSEYHITYEVPARRGWHKREVYEVGSSEDEVRSELRRKYGISLEEQRNFRIEKVREL